MPTKQDEIAQEFRRLVLRHGYRRSSVEDVARALKISKTTIYEFFESKKELYHYAVELWASEQRTKIESRLTQTTALGKILELTACAFADAREGLAANPLQDDTEPPEILAEVNDQIFGPLILGLISAGNASGELTVKDPKMTAGFIMAIGTEAIRMLLADPSSQAESGAMEAIKRLLGGNPKGVV